MGRIRDIRHDELIEATIKLAHRRGYAVMTMSEIAQEAGATAASINYYFGSKEKLMEATMRRILTRLRTALLTRLSGATTPYERLLAVVEANFDDALFTTEVCSVWAQFWASAPYAPRLARLYRINRGRVLSHMRAELNALLPPDESETVRAALLAYLDGVWVEAAQSREPLNAARVRQDARKVLDLLLS